MAFHPARCFTHAVQFCNARGCEPGEYRHCKFIIEVFIGQKIRIGTIDETVGETGFFGSLFETIKGGALSLKTKGYSLFTTIFDFFKEFGKTLFDSVNSFLTSMQGISLYGA